MARIAATIGAADATIETSGGFGLGLQRRAVHPSQSPSIAFDADRSQWAAVTGEIENLESLRGGLSRATRPAHDARDAELILALFDQHGASFVERLRGFFNIVIWSARTRRLFLFADRCGGVRSIYCYHGRGLLVFGSTAKSVIAHAEVPRAVDPVALDELLVLGHPIAPRTLLRGVQVLAGGTFLECGGESVRTRRYWRRRPFHDTGEELASLGERYLAALQGAVERSIDTRADVGILLSGGVDSAALVSLLHRAGHERLKTLSIHIGDPTRSDRDASRRIAQLYRTDHRSLDDLDASCLERLPQMLWHHESPASNFHPTYWLCEEARKECDAVIGGYGNDLVWGSIGPLPWARAWPLRSTPLVSLLGCLKMRRAMSRREVGRLRRRGPSTDLGLLRRLARYAARTGDFVTDFVAIDEAVYGDQRVYREIGKFALDAHSLGIRMPYTDAPVTDVAEAVPPAARSRTTNDGRIELKAFFKDVMARHQILPPDVIYRRKTWMHSPTSQWLRGEFGTAAGEILRSRRSRERGIFEPDRVDALHREHLAGAADHTYALGMLVAFEIWNRIFIDPPAIEKPQASLSDYRLASGD